MDAWENLVEVKESGPPGLNLLTHLGHVDELHLAIHVFGRHLFSGLPSRALCTEGMSQVASWILSFNCH